jgi:hypothetical protein
LALRLEETIAARAKANQIRKPANSVPTNWSEQMDTRQEVAKFANVSHPVESSSRHFTGRAELVAGD